jgi:hypothetical protein
MSLLAKLCGEIARRWRQGDLLRSALAGGDADAASFPLRRVEFPWRIPLLRRAPADALHSWPVLRAEIESLEAATDQGRAFAIEWSEQRSRQLGAQRWPAYARIDGIEQAAGMIAEDDTLARFTAVSTSVLLARPALRSLIESNPFLLLQTAEDWPKILTLLDWFEAHPRPGCYLREVDAPGIDTKFIEARRGMIVRLLDQALPLLRVADAPGAAGFETAFGLRCKPRLVRIRLLDETLALYPGLTDITLPVAQLAAWPIPCRRVFVTENEINGLSFPRHDRGLVIFGLGYGVEILAEIPWLRERSIYYWGDIDTHGFVMLARLRRHLPQLHSLLMDQDTLLRHEAHWTQESVQMNVSVDAEHLSPAEANLLHALRNQHFGDCIRLEQERISLGWLKAALDILASS